MVANNPSSAVYLGRPIQVSYLQVEKPHLTRAFLDSLVQRQITTQGLLVTDIKMADRFSSKLDIYLVKI